MEKKEHYRSIGEAGTLQKYQIIKNPYRLIGGEENNSTEIKELKGLVQKYRRSGNSTSTSICGERRGTEVFCKGGDGNRTVAVNRRGGGSERKGN